MPTGDDSLQLVSLADIAELTQVTRPAVSNWRRRYEDFPQPVRETSAVSLFQLGDIQAWLVKHNKKQIELTVRQEVWRALSVVRGHVTVTRSVEVCLWVLGMYALNADLDESDRLGPTIRYGSDPADLVASAAYTVGEYLEGQALQFDPGEVGEIAPVIAELPRLVGKYGAGEVCEALIAEASERQGNGAGQYVTPVGLAQLMIGLAGPIEGLVYDPACGWGNVLASVHRNRSMDSELYLIGDDTLPTAWTITALRMLIHRTVGSIGNQDAATTHTSRNADFVFTDPPFGGQHELWTWLNRTIHHLSATGRGFHLTPMGQLFWNARDVQKRRQLVEQGSVEAVIALPAGLYPHTSIRPALWLLRSPGEPRSSVLLVDGSDLGTPKRSQRALTPTDIEQVVECHRAWERGEQSPEAGLPYRAVPVAELLEGDCRLDAAYWTSPEATSDVHASRIRDAHAKVRDTTSQMPPLPELGDLQPGATQSVLVRDLGEVVRGVRVPRDLWGRGSAPVLRTKDVRNDWTAHPSTTVDLEDLGREVPQTRPGDVLVFAHDGKVRAGVDEIGGVVVAAPLQIVRLREQSGDRALLLAVLLTGTSIPAFATLSYADIRNLTVAWPSNADSAHVARVLRSVIAHRGAVRKAAAAADKLLGAMVAAVAMGLHPASPGAF